MTDWVRGETPPDSLFLVPPRPPILGSIERSFITNNAMMAYAAYILPLVEFNIDALRNIYQIDLPEMTLFEIRKAYPNGPRCALELGYINLLNNKDRVIFVKNQYPELDFLIGFMPGTSPWRWTCETIFEGEVLEFPIAFQNTDYIIYDLRSDK
jgi:hypothetical protein